MLQLLNNELVTVPTGHQAITAWIELIEDEGKTSRISLDECLLALQHGTKKQRHTIKQLVNANLRANSTATIPGTVVFYNRTRIQDVRGWLETYATCSELPKRIRFVARQGLPAHYVSTTPSQEVR
ncbi:hypothetical protein PQ472_03025 [Lacticaseibacillus pabuli]|uniref:Uncharacterized protein n=1 Tax=Lacticaseibacillus pabuli TaxID=3025672 RepID=A0ABY7WTV5_9LACO|nr:hypothetical protein [Lacticaseibacillus sp. KACC 23028]WDF83224.1 hypothetical protein PQ472_03025 [Lacticaseibacillus sp. KACC 23028]